MIWKTRLILSRSAITSFVPGVHRQDAFDKAPGLAVLLMQRVAGVAAGSFELVRHGHKGGNTATCLDGSDFPRSLGTDGLGMQTWRISSEAQHTARAAG